MSGHCQEHCDRSKCEGSTGSPPGHYDLPHVSFDGLVQWFGGHCPYCAGAKAERERIVEAIEAKRDDIVDNAFRCGLDEAAKIARGDA